VPRGSIARFTARITSIANGSFSACMTCSLETPMPCSALPSYFESAGKLLLGLRPTDVGW